MDRWSSRAVTAAAALLVVLLASASATSYAQVWNWAYAPPSVTGVDSSASGFSRADSNGFWAVGGRLRHYRSDGTLDVAAGASLGPGLNVVLPNGGLIASSQPSPPQIDFMQPYSCILAAYSAQGGALWTVALPSSQSYCQRLQVDGESVLWVAASGDGLNAFSSDGVLLHQLPRDPQSAVLTDFAASPASVGGVFAATDEPPSVRSYGDDASLHWSWTDPNPAPVIDRLLLGRDGNLYAAGRASGSMPSALRVVSLTTDGALRFARDTPLSIAALYGFVAANDDAFYVVDAITIDASGFSALALQRVASDGSIAWSRILDSAATCIGVVADCSATVTIDGDVLVMSETAAAGVTLWRYDADGNLLFSTAVANEGAAGLTALADGDALLSVSDGDDVYRVARYDRAGILQPPPSAAVTLDTFESPSVLTADGTSFVSANDATGHQIVRVDADGHAVWRIDLEGSATTATDLAVGGGLLCEASARVAGEFFYDALVSCYAADSGAPAWSMTLEQAVFGFPHTPIRVLDDGRVVVLDTSAASPEHLLVNPSGVVLHRSPIPELLQAPSIAIGSNGTTVLLPQDKSHMVAYGSDGAKLYNIDVADSLQAGDPAGQPMLTVLDDASTIVTLYASSKDTVTPYAWFVDATGSGRWLKALSDPQSIGNESSAFSASAAVGPDGSVYFDLASSVGTAERTVSLQARSKTDGHLLWQDSTIGQARQDSRLAINPVTGNLLLLLTNSYSIEIVPIDGRSGVPGKPFNLPCDLCLIENTTISGTDTLLAHAQIFEPTPWSERVFALRDATANRAQTRIDQPGLDGAWFAPYEGGQGFSLDFIASANTLFMPWFTFAQSGILDASGLAWYTLQGTVAPGATGADLAIAVSDAGAFNSGSVPGKIVGAAHLSFSDCNSGTLRYQFNPGSNGGAGGLISLSRLTANTDACVRADGSVAPAQVANAPANGFDAHLSGSWFDPATGGQGVEMTVIPAGSGSPGLVFVAWFTFDPAAHSDDALAQHWFTLQSDLSAAANGTVTLPIYRIIGGAFDATPTSNAVSVGHATLTIADCDHARLDYQFDATAVAHAFAGLAGSSHLVKIGGCVQ